MWYIIDGDNSIITRTYVRRLDQTEGIPDQTEYTIMKSEALIPEGGSAGDPETVMMAVGRPGSGNIETIWMGTKTMYSCRNSGMFHINICGIYKRLN